jgi:hypothetical protein
MSPRSLITRIVVVFLVLALPVAAFAGNAVGKPSGGGSFMEWQVNGSAHERVQLTVLDEAGGSVVLNFNAGQNPQFRLKDLGGNVEDGQYTYELRMLPKVPQGVQKQLEKARAEGDEATIKNVTKQYGLGRDITQYGVITVRNGSIVAPGGTESDANDEQAAAMASRFGDVTTDAVRPGQVVVNDTVIPDDLIVQSSACIGFDCVDGESFGTDTLRLKENNLRINFDDTSTSAGYAANDWRIIANDQASGGANYLAIEDSTAARMPFLVEAGAPASSIYVDSTGNIGFQQSAPVVDLHLTTGDTPVLRLDQSSSGGFTAQTWDVGGNEANFFIRDLTGGSRLSFRIRPGAPTSSIDIAASGNVGIGTASPESKLDVFGSNTLGVRVRGTTTASQIGDLYVDTAGQFVMSTVNGSGTQGFIDLRPEDDEFGVVIRNSTGLSAFPYANAYVTDTTDDYLSLDVNTIKTGDFVLTASGRVGIGAGTTLTHPLQVGTNTTNGNGAHLTAGGVWTSTSSRSFKEHIEEITADEALRAVAELKPVRYNYKTEPQETYVGFIAEDVPELVAQTSTDRKYLNSMDIVATLTRVVQEQQKTIEQLSKKVDQLEKNQ